MLSPDYLLHISEASEEIASQLHTEIIRKVVNRVMLRLGRGEDYILTSVDKWQIERLQEAGYLLEDIQAEIAKYTKLEQTEIAEAMEDAGVKALSYDDKIYQQAGLSPVPLEQSPHLIRLMQRNYEATINTWQNFTGTMASEVQKTFVNELDRAYNLVSTGAMSYTEAVKEVVNNLISNSAKVVYDTGHEDTIETATLRAVRTGISQATAQIQIERMNEMDVDLVIVSSHLGARPEHQIWQGKVYSRSGKTSKYDDFKEATDYGSVNGLCGANCRHSFSPFFEGMDNPFEQYDSEENKAQYEKEQYQRTLERRIRKTKRECIGLKESVESCKDEKLKFDLDMQYQRKARLLSAQNNAYKDYCERNNLKPLSDRIQIAQWDRKQAAMARAVARKQDKKINIKDIENQINENNIKIELLASEYSKKQNELEMALLFGNESAEILTKMSNEMQISKEKLDKLMLENDKLKEKIPKKKMQSFYNKIAQGKDLVGEIDYEKSAPDKKFLIEKAINVQGFDGNPQVVEFEEFKKSMNESGFYAERTYSANSQELLDEYQEQLYNGNWYVDCSEGGAQYGQGMYCASCYDLSDNKSIGGIGMEMSHYKEIGIDKGKAFSYTEAITLQKDAKIFELPHNAKAEEYISEKYKNAYLLKFANENQIKQVKQYIEFNEQISNLTFNEDMDFIDNLYQKRADATVGLEDLIKESLISMEDITDGKKYHGLKNPGVLVAEMGYDAIKAIGHGESGSYTVILNRTKLILCKGGSIYGN